MRLILARPCPASNKNINNIVISLPSIKLRPAPSSRPGKTRTITQILNNISSFVCDCKIYEHKLLYYFDHPINFDHHIKK